MEWTSQILNPADSKCNGLGEFKGTHDRRIMTKAGDVEVRARAPEHKDEGFHN